MKAASSVSGQWQADDGLDGATAGSQFGVLHRWRQIDAAAWTSPAFGLGEFGTNRIAAGLKADWYVDALDYLGEAPGIKFHILYNGQNGKEDFSLTGLGDRIKTAYQKPRFQFRLLEPL